MRDRVEHYSDGKCPKCRRTWELVEYGPETLYEMHARDVRMQFLKEQGAAALGHVELRSILEPNYVFSRGRKTPERVAIALAARLAGDKWADIAHVLGVAKETAEDYVEDGMRMLEQHFGSAAAAWQAAAERRHPAAEVRFCPFCGASLVKAKTSPRVDRLRRLRGPRQTSGGRPHGLTDEAA